MTRLQALPGTILVERKEVPVYAGRIVIPDSYRHRRASAEAEVVAVGEGVDFEVGDSLLLSSLAGHRLRIGPRGETVLIRLYPHQVLAKLHGENVSRREEHRPLPQHEVERYDELPEGA